MTMLLNAKEMGHNQWKVRIYRLLIDILDNIGFIYCGSPVTQRPPVDSDKLAFLADHKLLAPYRGKGKSFSHERYKTIASDTRSL